MKRNIPLLSLIILLLITGNVIAGGFASFLTSEEPMSISLSALVIMAIIGILAVASGAVHVYQVACALAVAGMAVIIAIVLTSL